MSGIGRLEANKRLRAIIDRYKEWFEVCRYYMKHTIDCPKNVNYPYEVKNKHCVCGCDDALAYIETILKEKRI